jgi:hypothetical protein
MEYHRKNEVLSADSPSYGKPQLLDEVRRRLRLKRDSLWTERAYILRIRNFILFSGRHHPRKLRAGDESTSDLSGGA